MSSLSALPSHQALKVHLNDLAVFRGYLQGLGLRELSKQYYYDVPEADLGEVVRKVWRAFAITASRQQDRRYMRLFSEISKRRVGILRKAIGLPVAAPAVAPAPDLDTFIESEGLDGFSEAEVLAYYREKYPEPSVGLRSQGISALITRLLAASKDLEPKTLITPALTDAVNWWFEGDLSARTSTVGIDTLGQLQALALAFGHRWHVQIVGVGPVRARAFLALWSASTQVFGAIPDHVLLPARERSELRELGLWGVVTQSAVAPLERFSPPVVINGLSGKFRGDRTKAFTSADTDAEIIAEMLQNRGQYSAHTLRAYRKEWERFWCWCVLVRGKSIADLVTDDARRYKEFLATLEPREAWVNSAWVSRDSPAWRPFRGLLKPAQVATTMVVLRSGLAYMAEVGYLFADPFASVKTRAPKRLTVNHALTQPHAARLLLTPIEAKSGKQSSVAMLKLIAELLVSSGVRRQELVGLQRQDLQVSFDGNTSLRVIGKGNKERIVPLAPTVLESLKSWHDTYNLVEFAALDPAASLVCGTVKPKDPSRPSLGYVALDGTRVWRAIQKLCELTGLDPHKRRVHALRHTFGTALARAVNDDLRLVALVLGHETIETTKVYVAPNREKLEQAVRQLRFSVG